MSAYTEQKGMLVVQGMINKFKEDSMHQNAFAQFLVLLR